MKKSKAMQGLDEDFQDAKEKTHSFNERVKGDMHETKDKTEAFNQKVKGDMGKTKNKMDAAGRNMAEHVEQAGAKAKGHFDNKKK